MTFTFTRVDTILLRLLLAILISSLAFNMFLHSRISTSLPSQSMDHNMFIRQREMLQSIEYHHQDPQEREGKDNRNLQEELSCGTESIWYEYGCVFRPAELLSESVKQWQSGILLQSGGGGIGINNNEDMENFDSLYGNSDMAGFTQQGKDHAINQDRGLIISPFVITTVHKTSSESQQTNSKTHEKTNDFLIGIFDGHGTLGHDVAQFLQDNFPLRLHQKLALLTSKYGGRDKIEDEEIQVRKALHETFIEMDTELPPISGNDGGSTASVILRLGSKLYFANAGDSLSFLASFPSVLYDSKDGKDANMKNELKASIVYRNRYDKAYLPEEKERITKLGGNIFIPPHPEFSRVNAFYPQKKEVMSLAMSRSIGDWPHGKIGVIPDPIIDIVNLEELTASVSVNVNVDAPLDFFVVTSSDGLYDHRQAQFVADRLAETYSENNLEGGSDAIKDQYRRYPIVRQCANIIHLATPQNP
eukprot:CAMPEP_0194088816 /NCGR_PEP_ID=MMETSP0149-20130528/31175_1 /TAXON_ID=122233 /ORGANISM="Chaetoceros debilis, Strain MM31A-1" /LENGTH=474 /DNA_ID=CAMNT_0038772557 /DNA_START=74 /DNA_END=1495 /DNA_ORIENTATION=+